MVTYILIGITCLISIQAFSNQNLLNKLILSPYRIKNNGEWIRMLGSGFLHADWNHLLINMFVLYMFGTQVEREYQFVFGNAAIPMYLALYLSSIVAANSSSFLKNQNNSSYLSLGASGATSAIVFVDILFNPMQLFYGIIPGFMFGILYLAYCQYAARQNADRINHEAHFYGAVYGLLFTLVFKPGLLKFFWHQIWPN
ncbi:MAG: rhomboid family intramembrane serine protease [Bacteroidia bacterium]|nr:rhomboid family intramembrane serine protease [Bacteroidia bacterium]